MSVKQLKLSNEIKSVLVSKIALDALLISKYRKDWDNYYLEGVTVNNLDFKSKCTSAEESEGYSSDDTVLYNWIPPPTAYFQDKKNNTIPRRCSAFNINVIGIKTALKHWYWLKCKMPPCESSFSTIVGWNTGMLINQQY